jgi:hypothetical protein
VRIPAAAAAPAARVAAAAAASVTVSIVSDTVTIRVARPHGPARALPPAQPLDLRLILSSWTFGPQAERPSSLDLTVRLILSLRLESMGAAEPGPGPRPGRGRLGSESHISAGLAAPAAELRALSASVDCHSVGQPPPPDSEAGQNWPGRTVRG